VIERARQTAKEIGRLEFDNKTDPEEGMFNLSPLEGRA